MDRIFNHHARLTFPWSSQLNLNNIFKETTDQYLKFFILEKRNLLTLQHGLYREGSKGGWGRGEKSSFMQDFLENACIVYRKQYFMPQKFAREDFESHFSLPFYEIYT